MMNVIFIFKEKLDRNIHGKINKTRPVSNFVKVKMTTINE